MVGAKDFAQFATPESQGDSVWIVRSSVVDDWLRLSRDYFATDLVFLLQLFRSHSALCVDEPWGRYHVDAGGRITEIRGQDPRRLDDISSFVRDFRPVVGTSACAPVDSHIEGMWMTLLRARRYRQALALAGWMRERDISIPGATRRRLQAALRRRLSPAKRSDTYVL